MLALNKFLILIVFWLLISGRLNIADPADRYLIGCGIVACAFVTYLAGRKGMLDEEGHPIHLALPFFSYIPWLLWEIVLANLDVAYRVWHPRAEIAPRLIVIPFDTRTDVGTVIYANSITLTPGTITIGIDSAKRQMLVHALTDRSARGLLSGHMHERVRRVEGTG
ncbi:MAG TPA: Na+/H+ antiporter subunit E [Candidatus Acidoferrales bacterium]|nr:Na+/H+ antiporter subunit E [Candidatus Acidoferrales bacterium]